MTEDLIGRDVRLSEESKPKSGLGPLRNPIGGQGRFSMSVTSWAHPHVQASHIATAVITALARTYGRPVEDIPGTPVNVAEQA